MLSTGAVRRIDLAIEACWLLAAIVIPLIVLPERWFFSFTAGPKIAALRILAGAMLALLLIRWATTDGSPAAHVSQPFLRRLTTWPTSSPANLVVAAVLLLVGVTTLSMALSVSPYHSIFGKEPGGDGYDLYTTSCYAVFAIGVATRLRTPLQVWRLIGAISLAGMLSAFVGIAQIFGFSPLDISATSGVRVTGTAGNPIFFGALLVMTVPMSFGGLFWLAQRWGSSSGKWWVASILVIGTQILPLAYTLARGPWVGGAVAFAAIVALTAWLVGRRSAATSAAILGIAIALTFVSLAVPGWLGRTTDDAPGSRISESVPAQAVTSRALTAPGEIAGGLSGRAVRWSTSLKLAFQRPPVPDGNDLGAATRFFAGYGPDMFVFAFPLLAPSELASVRTHAAHNDYLNRLVEQGILGLLAYAVLAAAVVAVIVQAVRTRRANRPLMAVVIAVAAALAARAAEQTFGIAKPGDLTIFWLLVGLMAAAPAALSGRHSSPDKAPAPKASVSPPRTALTWVPLAVTAIAVIFLIGLTWIKGVGYLRADHLAVQTLASFQANPALAMGQIAQSITIAPDVPNHYHRRSLMLQALAEGDPSRRLDYLREAVATDMRAVQFMPMSIDSNLAAAFSSWSLAVAGDQQMALQALALYERLALLTPQNPTVKSRLDQLKSVIQITPAGQP